ncbi:hypothetical protein BBJ28_00022712, partial [Nothophytophthora sp. Chile5]
DGEGGGNEKDGNRDEGESARLESVLDGTPPQQEEQQQQKAELEDEKMRVLRVGSKNPQVAALTRKLDQAKKLNAELHQFYKNEAVSRENFPQKRRALLDELRVCKEKIKHFKEQQRITDEKSFRMHQKTIDLAAKNKELTEKVRQLEGTTALPNASTPSSPVGSIGEGGASSQEVEAIIASQEEAITRLHQRVALMKRAHKADQAKSERLLKASQDEIEQTRDELAAFHQQLFVQERAARNHFLLMKKLKREVHELAKAQQSSQHFQQFLVGREVRFASKSGSPRRNHSDTQHQPQEVGPSLNPGRRIHDTLRYLGFVMPLTMFRQQRNILVKLYSDFTSLLLPTSKQIQAKRGRRHELDARRQAQPHRPHLPPACTSLAVPAPPSPTTSCRDSGCCRGQEIVQGQVIISSPKGFSHQGLAMKVEGSARLQLSTKSAGLFDAFYNTVAPMELVYFHLPVAPAGKVPPGISKFPFEFELQGNDGQQLFETYHGVYVSVKYEIVCDCVRGIMKNKLHKTLEFVVEVPDSPEEFHITPDSLENVRPQQTLPSVPYFHITGKIHRTNCPVNLPFTGEVCAGYLECWNQATACRLNCSQCWLQVVIEEANTPVKSVELQLIRVESVAHAEGVARDGKTRCRKIVLLCKMQTHRPDGMKHLVVTVNVSHGDSKRSDRVGRRL